MTRSAKAKGRGGQQEVRDKLLETFPEFEPDDIKSTTMGDGGEDIQLSPAARKTMPITIEVKRRKSGFKTAYGYIDQASKHAKGEPVVSWIGCTGISNGTPPAAMIPSRIRFASSI